MAFSSMFFFLALLAVFAMAMNSDLEQPPGVAQMNGVPIFPNCHLFCTWEGTGGTATSTVATEKSSPITMDIAAAELSTTASTCPSSPATVTATETVYSTVQATVTVCSKTFAVGFPATPPVFPKFQFHPDVVEHLFMLTNGHPGLTIGLVRTILERDVSSHSQLYAPVDLFLLRT
jgi:hypothetical protein